MLLAFGVGLFVDMFYDSPGVHTASLVFISYARRYILQALEPRSGYRITGYPTAFNFGVRWFAVYLAIMLGLEILIYHSLEAFSFVYFDRILFNTLLSFAVSYVLSMLYQVFIRF